MKNLFKSYPISTYIFLSFFITYIIGIGGYLAMDELQNLIGSDIPIINELLLKFGPTLAGLIMVAITLGKSGIHDLFQRLGKFSSPVWLYAIALLVPPLISLATLYLRGWWSYTADITLSDVLLSYGGNLLIACLLGGGLGEELGWRGFMLPKLMDRYNAWVATFWVGVVWVAWHIPAYVVFNKGDDDPLVPFLVIVMMFSYLFTWGYHRSGGSLIIPILMHGSANAVFYTQEEILPQVVALPGYQPAFDLTLMAGYVVITVLLLGISKFQLGKISLPATP